MCCAEAKQALTQAVKMLHPDQDRLRLACTTLGKCCLDLHNTDGEPICQYLALPFPYHKCDSGLFPPGARCGCRQNCMSRLPEASPLLYAPDPRKSQSAVGMLLSICKPAAIWARLLHEGQQSIAADWDDEMSKVAWSVPDGFPGRACRAVGALQHGSTMAHQGACSVLLAVFQAWCILDPSQSHPSCIQTPVFRSVRPPAGTAMTPPAVSRRT